MIVTKNELTGYQNLSPRRGNWRNWRKRVRTHTLRPLNIHQHAELRVTAAEAKLGVDLGGLSMI